MTVRTVGFRQEHREFMYSNRKEVVMLLENDTLNGLSYKRFFVCAELCNAHLIGFLL